MSDRRGSRRGRSTMRPPSSSNASGNELDSLRRTLHHLKKRLAAEEDDNNEYRKQNAKFEDENVKLEDKLHDTNKRLKSSEALVRQLRVSKEALEVDSRTQRKGLQAELDEAQRMHIRQKDKYAKLAQQRESSLTIVNKACALLKTLDEDDDYMVDDKSSQETLPMAAGVSNQSRGGSSDDESLPEPASAPAALGPASAVDAAHAAAAEVPPILPGNAAPAPIDPLVVRVAADAS